MAKEKTQRAIAERFYDQYTAENRRTTYYRRWHPLRKERFLLTCGVCALGLVWAVGSWALGDESIWSNGAVAPSHALWERDCAACHTETFSSVPEKTCLGCHRVEPHVPPTKGADPSCGTCHAEHRGRENLISVSDAHCNGCHADHHGIVSFADHGPLPPLERDQHLKFGHKAHLDAALPDKVRLAGLEEPLACADCHQAAGEGFRPIAFEAHCARCHREMLDPGVSDLAIPHGIQPARLLTWITGFYGTHTRDGAPAEAPRPSAEARADTQAALAALLGRERASCGICHEIETPSGGGAPRIVPPRVPEHWRRAASFDATGATPLARFDHKAHRFAIEGAPSGPEGNCRFCHKGAAESTTAGDLSLPPLESCRECHRPGGAGTSCVGCHPFHGGPR